MNEGEDGCATGIKFVRVMMAFFAKLSEWSRGNPEMPMELVILVNLFTERFSLAHFGNCAAV